MQNHSMSKNKAPLKAKKPLYNNEKSILAFLDFIGECQTRRLRINLRNFLLDYIVAYKDALPLHFEELIHDFQLLFAFLDRIEEEG